MASVLVIDARPSRAAALRRALSAWGFAVKTVADPQEAPVGKPFDGIVLVAESGDLGVALAQTRHLREEGAPAVVLVTNLDRSGWDRTFGTAEALEVDALFDLPPDERAVVARLRGILQARAQPPLGSDAPDLAVIIARAIANEEAAEAFYKRAAEAVANPATRDALLQLARDEGEHKRLLEDFRAGKRPLPAGHTEVPSLVETMGTPEITGDLSPADAFLLAARKEKLAVEFYDNWAALYPAGPERELLEGLAEVERRHKVRVEEMFADAAFPEAF